MKEIFIKRNIQNHIPPEMSFIYSDYGWKGSYKNQQPLGRHVKRLRHNNRDYLEYNSFHFRDMGIRMVIISQKWVRDQDN